MSTRSAPASRSCGRGWSRTSARRSRSRAATTNPNSVVRIDTRRPSPSRNANRTPVTTLAGAPLPASRSATLHGAVAHARVLRRRADAPRCQARHDGRAPQAAARSRSSPHSDDPVRRGARPDRAQHHGRARAGTAATARSRRDREDRADARSRRARARTRSPPGSRARPERNEHGTVGRVEVDETDQRLRDDDERRRPRPRCRRAAATPNTARDTASNARSRRHASAAAPFGPRGPIEPAVNAARSRDPCSRKTPATL